MGWFFDEVVARTANTTLSYDDDFVATSTIDVMLTVQACFAGCGILLCAGTIIYLHIFCYKRLKPSQIKVYVMLNFYLLFMFGLDISLLILAIDKFSEARWLGCSFGGSMPPFFYVAAHACTYLIFLQRCKIGIAQKKSRLHLLRKFAMYGTYAMPIFIIWLLLTVRGLSLPNHVCVMTYPWWIGLMFFSADITFSAVFLILFLVPVISQVSLMSASRNIREMDSTSKLKRIALKNLFWSSFTLITTAGVMGTITFIPVYTNFHGMRSDQYHLQIIQLMATPIDSICNYAGLMAITSAVWSPKTWKTLPQKLSSSGKGSSMRRTIRNAEKRDAEGSGISSALSLK